MIDEALERRIDEVGRDRMLAYMRANGWGPGTEPDKWIWRVACFEVEAGRDRPPEAAFHAMDELAAQRIGIAAQPFVEGGNPLFSLPLSELLGR